MAGKTPRIKVERLLSESRVPLMKYDDIMMREPSFKLERGEDYLRWLRELEQCANSAGLLGHLDGTAVRPEKPGPLRALFDKNRVAMNNFVFWNIHPSLTEGRDKEKVWLDALADSEVDVESVLACARGCFDEKELIDDFLSYPIRKAFLILPVMDAHTAMTHLNYEWDNLKEFVPEFSDDHYIGAAAFLVAYVDSRLFRDICTGPLSSRGSADEVRALIEARLQKT
ncbi:Zn(2)-C6 fungal-type domain-containing protein [Purpureocillium lavendulum]|uniref:Zn(2)-C6 fungal-type domain-containing protein n=1 Tax=Purpureocillium lavendulum TaxID=1247861 RepID=A0AB34FJH3_9HYPO|nr:Zn(2)-C6 fungal-type domain-containing protein [Purpureocillium lavendulum]